MPVFSDHLLWAPFPKIRTSEECFCNFSAIYFSSSYGRAIEPVDKDEHERLSPRIDLQAHWMEGANMAFYRLCFVSHWKSSQRPRVHFDI